MKSSRRCAITYTRVTRNRAIVKLLHILRQASGIVCRVLRNEPGDATNCGDNHGARAHVPLIYYWITVSNRGRIIVALVLLIQRYYSIDLVAPCDDYSQSINPDG